MNEARKAMQMRVGQLSSREKATMNTKRERPTDLYLHRENLVMRIAGVALVCLVLMAVPAGAQNPEVPAEMNYQATLLDDNGIAVVTGTYTIEMRIYDTDADTTAPNNLIWGPQIFDGIGVGTVDGHSSQVQVIDGQFSIVLGDLDTGGKMLTDAFTAPDRWLDITVIDFPIALTDTTFAPRQRILSAPYAMHAKDADTLGNQTLQVSAGDVAIGVAPVPTISLTIGKDASPTLRLENSDTTAEANRSLIQFTESGNVRGELGFVNTADSHFWLRASASRQLRLQADTDITQIVGGVSTLKLTNTLVRGLVDGQFDKNLTVLGTQTGGTAFIGDVGHNSWAGFANNATATATGYALIQSDSGTTILNAAPSQLVSLNIGNSTKVKLSSTLFTSLVNAQFNQKLTVLGETFLNQKLQVAGQTFIGSFTQTFSNPFGGGSITVTDAAFAHKNFATLAGVALRQTNTGQTTLNASSGQALVFTSGSSTIMGTWLPNAGINWQTRDTNPSRFEVLGEIRVRPRNSSARYWAMTVDNEADNDLFFWRAGVIRRQFEPNGTAAVGSDRRLKTDIASLENALETSLKLKPMSFRFKEWSDSKLKEIGFIAQDVQSVAPSLVSEMGEYLGVNYDGFGVIAIGAIQELNEMLLAEKKVNEDLQERLDRVEALVEDLIRTAQ